MAHGKGAGVVSLMAGMGMIRFMFVSVVVFALRLLDVMILGASTTLGRWYRASEGYSKLSIKVWRKCR